MLMRVALGKSLSLILKLIREIPSLKSNLLKKLLLSQRLRQFNRCVTFKQHCVSFVPLLKYSSFRNPLGRYRFSDRDIQPDVGEVLHTRLSYPVQLWNSAAPTGQVITLDDTSLTLTKRSTEFQLNFPCRA